MNSINNTIDESSFNKINNTINNYESLRSNSTQKPHIKQNNDLNLIIRKMSRNPGNRRQKIKLKTESYSQTTQNKKSIKHNLTPYQKLLKQKQQIKILNNLKCLRSNNVLRDFCDISIKKKNKNLNLIGDLHLTSYMNEDNNIENNNFSNINNRFTPQEYFNKIKIYKNSAMNYNPLKLDLYNVSLNQRINNKTISNSIKIMCLNNNNKVNNFSQVSKKMRDFSTKNELIKKYIGQEREHKNFDSDLSNSKEKTQYNNRNFFNRTNVVFLDCSRMTIPKKKKYNIKISLSQNKSKYLDSRIDTTYNTGSNKNGRERYFKVNFFKRSNKNIF